MGTKLLFKSVYIRDNKKGSQISLSFLNIKSNDYIHIVHIRVV